MCVSELFLLLFVHIPYLHFHIASLLDIWYCTAAAFVFDSISVPTSKIRCASSKMKRKLRATALV